MVCSYNAGIHPYNNKTSIDTHIHRHAYIHTSAHTYIQLRPEHPFDTALEAEGGNLQLLYKNLDSSWSPFIAFLRTGENLIYLTF